MCHLATLAFCFRAQWRFCFATRSPHNLSWGASRHLLPKPFVIRSQSLDDVDFFGCLESGDFLGPLFGFQLLFASPFPFPMQLRWLGEFSQARMCLGLWGPSVLIIDISTYHFA